MDALERAQRNVAYFRLRLARPELKASDVYRYVSTNEPGLAQNIDQFLCRHSWVVSEENDRCYCCLCLMDGDG